MGCSIPLFILQLGTPLCACAELTVDVKSSKPVIKPGEQVTITSTTKNNSVPRPPIEITTSITWTDEYDNLKEVTAETTLPVVIPNRISKILFLLPANCSYIQDSAIIAGIPVTVLDQSGSLILNSTDIILYEQESIDAQISVIAN